MTTATFTLTGFEAEARIRIKAAREAEAAWNPTRAAILNVFEAMPAYALSVERIIKIGEAMSNMTMDEATTRKELTKLTRSSLLRAYVHSEKRLYELAYKD